MSELLLALYLLGAAQGMALAALLMHVDVRARRFFKRRGLWALLGGLFWILWTVAGLAVCLGWVVSYPWRRRLHEEREQTSHAIAAERARRS